jgi:hypothetical protein
MGVITSGIGIALAALAWFNPLAFPFVLQIALFILGFDLSGIVGKVALFVLIFMMPPVLGVEVGAFVVALVLMLLAELAIFAFELDRMYRLLLKPGTVFVAAFLALGFQPALIVAGVDLLLNLTTGMKTRKPPKPKAAKEAQKGGHKGK